MADRQRPRAGRVLRWFCAQAALYAGAVLLGAACFVLLFQTDLWAGVTILFYRGLILLAVAFLITLGVTASLAGLGRGWGLRRRDALGACVLALSLNLSAFVVLPVTVDRSISVFLLGQMAAHPGERFDAERARTVFEAVYLGSFRQMDRRLAEQAASGNVARIDAGYMITAQGEAFVRFSRWVARLFRVDPRMVAGVEPPPAPAPDVALGLRGPVE
jgi:hypothetical protein